MALNPLEKITYQANEIIECSKNFNVQEMRLFYLGIQGLFPELPQAKEKGIYYDVDFKQIIIDTTTLIEIFGGNKWYYTELKKTCTNLLQKVFFIKDKNNINNFKGITVFSEINFDTNIGLTIEFNPKMKPFLLELANKPFTKIQMKEVFNLKSDYAIRLLELMLQYQNSITKTREISMEDLRFYLSLPKDLYKNRINNFKSRVLDKPLEEININTRYKISYENIKKGRKIWGFKFTLELPKTNKNDNSLASTDFEKTSPAMYAMQEIGLVKNVAADIEKLFSEKRIIKTIERVKIESKKMKINNLPGFVANAIKDDYYNIESNSLNEKGQINAKQKTVDAAKNIIPEFEQDKIDNTVDETSLFAQFLKNTTSKIGNID